MGCTATRSKASKTVALTGVVAGSAAVSRICTGDRPASTLQVRRVRACWSDCEATVSRSQPLSMLTPGPGPPPWGMITVPWLVSVLVSVSGLRPSVSPSTVAVAVFV